MKKKVTRSAELRFKALPGRDSADPFDGEKEANISLRIVKMSADPHRTPHVHPHSAEAVYVIAGSGILWVEGERIPVEQGDIFLIPAGAKHATLPDSETEMELICFFPHPDLSQNLHELSDSVDTYE
jgi:quercetin dioxygenase-like cupin family protein